MGKRKTAGACVKSGAAIGRQYLTPGLALHCVRGPRLDRHQVVRRMVFAMRHENVVNQPGISLSMTSFVCLHRFGPTPAFSSPWSLTDITASLRLGKKSDKNRHSSRSYVGCRQCDKSVQLRPPGPLDLIDETGNRDFPSKRPSALPRRSFWYGWPMLSA